MIKLLLFIINYAEVYNLKLIVNKIKRKMQKLKRMIMNHLPAYVYLKLVWKQKSGSKKRLNLRNPKGFNEKLNWLKIYNRDPRYIILADKYRVREWVSKTIGEEYLVPLIAVFDSADEIDFDLLPNRFVLKCNHNSGEGMCICRDKSKIDKDLVKKRLDTELKKDYSFESREWSYKHIAPKVLCEELLVGEKIDEFLSTIINYKFYCFNGEPKFLYVAIDNTDDGKKGRTKLNMKDLNWEMPPFYRTDHASIKYEIKKPEVFDQMVTICKKLSANIPFVRVDLYCIKEKIFFSEMTFYPGGGFALFSPSEWEDKIGDWLILPQKNNKKGLKK